MLFMIIILGVGVSLALAKYLNRKRAQQHQDRRERRDEQFLKLLESLKKDKGEEKK